MKKKQTAKQTFIFVKDIFKQVTTANKIVLFKNIKQNKTFVFNQTQKDNWDFMFNLIKDCIVDKQYKINDMSFCVEIFSSSAKDSLLHSFKAMFKK